MIEDLKTLEQRTLALMRGLTESSEELLKIYGFVVQLRQKLENETQH